MPNSNTRNGSIQNCRKHANTTPNKKPKAKDYATTLSGEQYDTYEFFAHGGVVYRKASDRYRVDESNGCCQRCVRGKDYKHGHHHTCKLAKKYCDIKKALLNDINKRMQYEGRESGFCHPNTGALLNLVEKNGSLEPLQDLPPPTTFFTPEINRTITMSDRFSNYDNRNNIGNINEYDYDSSLGYDISTEMNLISESIMTKEIKERKQQQHQQLKQGWNRLLFPTTKTKTSNITASVPIPMPQQVIRPPMGVVLADDQTTVSNVTDLQDNNSKHFTFSITYDYNDDLLSPERITTEINLRMDHPYTIQRMKKKRMLSMPVSAFIEYLLDLFPFRFDKNNNMKGGKNKEAFKFYQRSFRPGTLSFKVPCASSIDPRPCPNYKAIEGRTFYLVNWHLNIPGIDLRCHKPSNGIYNICNGNFIHQSSYDYKENDAVTIVLDPEGNTNYAVSMRYKCNRCKQVLKGNDGELFGHLPYHHRKGYDVDPKYATGQKHLTMSASNIMERVMVKDGSGDMISHMFHEMRGLQYEHVNNDYFSQVNHENKDDDYIATNLLEEQDYQGKYMHTGITLRSLYTKGAYSNLTTTGVSNYMRHTREIQSVGCSSAVSTDLTYAVNKNYHSNKFNNGKAATSTITTGEGMKASACIVPGGDSKYIAHQQETFSRRPNVDPKVFVTDDMPRNITMYEEIMGNILFCLGLFHFVQRITRTMVPGHEDFEAAVRDLTNGLSHDNQADVDNVKQALKQGLLGTTRNYKHTDDEINKMMKTFSWNRNYRKYIRSYLKNPLVINAHLTAFKL